MQFRPLKIITKIIVILIIIMILSILFLFKGEVQSIVPLKIQKEYALKVKKINKRKIFVISPKENNDNIKDIILYIHGGAYMGAIYSEHWNFIADIVDDTGATIIVPDYPLTPKYNYKDVFYMMEPLYKGIVENKKDTNFILMGDSAGGGLSLALIQKMGEENIEMPDKTILLSPWLDVRLQNPDINKIEPNDPILNRLSLIISGEHYSGEDGKDSYFVNPVDGPLNNLKNITIFTGTHDILNADANLLVERANRKNIKIDLREYENAVHIWMLTRNSKKPEYKAEEAYQEIITLLK